MTIMIVYLDSIYEKQQITPRKCLTMAKNKKGNSKKIVAILIPLSHIQDVYQSEIVISNYIPTLVPTSQ